MSVKRISGALIVSIVIHCVIMLIANAVHITQTERFKEVVSVEIFPPTKPSRPSVRGGSMAKYIAKYMAAKPTISANRPVNVEEVQTQPRVTTHAAVPAPSIHPQTVLEFSNKVVKLDAPINPNVPKVSNPMPTAPDAASASIGRGIGGSVQVKGAFERPTGLTMVEHIGASRKALGDVVESITLGSAGVPPLNPPNDEAYHDMYFKGAGTNPFIDTEDDHLSTFGMDVDTGSYSITRRYLMDGYLPPPEAVRVEEFVNSFDYNLDPPSEDAFAIHIDGAPSKFGEGKRLQLLRIGLQGRVIPDEHRKDATLTFVIDVSGSMEKENRLELVKKALTLLVDQLRPTDKVGIVVYGSRGRLVLPHTGIERRSEILAAINSLQPD
ncbi:VWA domain-containing protein, partial [Candidatus Poribacteria bacterium]|nr:VWA domain-containing protein [Candidatus Poribacteria bacterium]